MKNQFRRIRFLPLGAELLKSAVSLIVLGSGISAVAVLFGVTLNPDATLPIILSAVWQAWGSLLHGFTTVHPALISLVVGLYIAALAWQVKTIRINHKHHEDKTS